MLALKNKSGIVEGSVPGLADMARLNLADTVEALKTLSEPDEYSRTKEFEGRRIQEIEGGWLVLNHEKWRKKMSADERRDYLRIKQREHRERVNKSVNKRGQSSTLSTHTEAEAYSKAEAVPKHLNDVLEYAKQIGLGNGEAQKFFDYFQSNGWKVGGRAAMRDWKASLRNWKRNQKPVGARTDNSTPIDKSKIEVPERFKAWVAERYPQNREAAMKWQTWADVPRNGLRDEWWREEKEKLAIDI